MTVGVEKNRKSGHILWTFQESNFQFHFDKVASPPAPSIILVHFFNFSQKPNRKKRALKVNRKTFPIKLIRPCGICTLILIGKQFSLDSRMDLYGFEANALNQDDDISNGTVEQNKPIKEDVEDTWEGTKSRYCSRTRFI